MESSSTLLTSKSSPTRKQTKQKRKTTTNRSIKVRYISNPMRVETCASKFRELVQELTGQNATDLPQEPTTFAAAEPHQAEMNHAPSDGEIREYYSPLDEEVQFNAPQMSTGLSGFFSSGFYNVNAVGSIGSL